MRPTEVKRAITVEVANFNATGERLCADNRRKPDHEHQDRGKTSHGFLQSLNVRGDPRS